MQKIIVCLKRVVDYNVRIRVKPDGSGVITDGLKMSINPFDEIAREEALRIREKGQAEEIVAVSIGPETTSAAKSLGLDVVGEASTQDADGLLAAVEAATR